MLFSGPVIGEVTLSRTNDHLVLHESSLRFEMSIHYCLDIIRWVSLSAISLSWSIFEMIVYDNITLLHSMMLVLNVKHGSWRHA